MLWEEGKRQSHPLLHADDRFITLDAIVLMNRVVVRCTGHGVQVTCRGRICLGRFLFVYPASINTSGEMKQKARETRLSSNDPFFAAEKLSSFTSGANNLCSHKNKRR